MSRFGILCKRCRCFRENISSQETKVMMDEQNELCLAGESPYQSRECRFFLDIEERVEDIAKEAIPEKKE
jgi:hypothetical protein